MASFMKEFEHLRIRLEKIKKATNSFGSKVIGRGGFGTVYEGELLLSTGRSIVAVKRLNRRFGQGDPEFLKELMMLSRYKHQNLISLLGFCDEEDEKVLVYEYASNGSLDRHLSDLDLTWAQRIRICLGAAKGLSYLHDPNGAYQRVLHCDIKSSNILLDENMTAKVSDFGLSKMASTNHQYSVVVTNASGTPGYCDPLYMMASTLRKESDVYSFGVVLFEVLCGRLCCEYRNGLIQNNFVPLWKQRFSKKKLHENVFQPLMPQMSLFSLKIFANVAFQCLHDSRERRPTMSVIVENLQSALGYQELHDRKLKLPEGYRERPSKRVARQVPEDDETYWEQMLPNDYQYIIKQSKDYLQWTTKKELYSIFSKGFLIINNHSFFQEWLFSIGDPQWFSLDKRGKKCLTLSPRRACTLTFSRCHKYNWQPLSESRFREVLVIDGELDIKILLQKGQHVLSPQTRYASYLVYKLAEDRSAEQGLRLMEVSATGSDEHWYIFHFFNERTQTQVVRPNVGEYTGYIPRISKPKDLPQRTDGWIEVKLYEFQLDTTKGVIPILELKNAWGSVTVKGMRIQCIEIRQIWVDFF